MCSLSGWGIQVQLLWWPFDHHPPHKILESFYLLSKFQGGQFAYVSKHKIWIWWSVYLLETTHPSCSNDHHSRLGLFVCLQAGGSSPTFFQQKCERSELLRMAKGHSTFTVIPLVFCQYDRRLASKKSMSWQSWVVTNCERGLSSYILRTREGTNDVSRCELLKVEEKYRVLTGQKKIYDTLYYKPLLLVWEPYQLHWRLFAGHCTMSLKA